MATKVIHYTTRTIAVHIKKGSSLFDFVSEVESKTTLSSKEILEFLINWAYEDYFYNDVNRLLELIDKKRIKS